MVYIFNVIYICRYLVKYRSIFRSSKTSGTLCHSRYVSDIFVLLAVCFTFFGASTLPFPILCSCRVFLLLFSFLSRRLRSSGGGELLANQAPQPQLQTSPLPDLR